MKERLQVVTNVALLCAALLVSAAVIKSYFLASPNAKAPADLSGLVGDILPGVSTGDLGQANVVLAYQTNCTACKAGSAFYKRLSRASLKSGGRMRILVASPDEDSILARSLGDLGIIQVKRIPAGTSSALWMRATPTIAVLDRAGKVKYIKVGVLSKQSEEEFFANLRSLCGDCEFEATTD